MVVIIKVLPGLLLLGRTQPIHLIGVTPRFVFRRWLDDPCGHFL
jgi:hypothetical protein